MSNNDAERALRHAVLGRKNFYGSKTINGADTAAILYTIIESCKKAQLDPIAYIKYVIIEKQSKFEIPNVKFPPGPSKKRYGARNKVSQASR